MQTSLHTTSTTTAKSAENAAKFFNASALHTLFNCCSHGIWIVDSTCYVHFANTVAKQMTTSARCLQVQENRLKTAHKTDQLSLLHGIQKATQFSASNQSSAMRTMLRLRVIDTKPPTDLLALVTPLQLIKDNFLFGSENEFIRCYPKYSDKNNNYNGLAAIQMQKTSVIDPAMLCLLARSYKLTNAEELVLSLLCDGLDTPEIATTLNVAVSTIRTHVRSLFEKMQTNSLRQLVIKVAMLPSVAGVVGML